VLALAYRRLTYAGIKQAVLNTTATSSMVLLLAVTSNVFGAVFARLGTANWITETMLALPLPPTVMLVMVIIAIFVLGWPFEWPAIVLVFVPIFYPVVAALKFDMVWFGALVAVTLQTAFLSPPVAMSAYYLKQVVKDWSLATIYKGMMEFMVIQCVVIGLMVAFPGIATYLPNTLREAANAVRVEAPVEGDTGMGAYTSEGSYEDLLRGALREERADEAGKNTEEEKAGGDDLEKGDMKPEGETKPQ
jgi:TRAP-type mannitol/chloroaromatic compound transport system permease large subunit